MITTGAPASPPSRPTASMTVAALAAGIVASLLPLVFGAAFLVSVVIHRPLVAMLARRWPSLSGGPLDQESPRIRSALSRITTVWGVVLLAIGILQGVGAIVAGLSITNPASFAARTLFALAVLIVMSIGTAAYLRRRPADAQTVNEAGDDPAIGSRFPRVDGAGDP
jgi:hypothetical protein